MINVFNRVIKILNKIEEIVLVVLLSLMIIFAVLQIFLRLVWIDAFIKYSVLWIGLIAASMTTGEKKHIKIDIIGRLSKGRLRSFVLAFTHFFAAFVAFLIAYNSIFYIINIEMQSTDPPPFLNIPRWGLLLVFPFGFGLICFRFFLKGCRRVYFIIKNIDDTLDKDNNEVMTNEIVK